MNEVNNIENNKKRLKIYYSLLITVICIIGVSFAWFRLYLRQNDNNTIASRKCLDVSLVEETSKIALTDAYPLTDKAGLKENPFTFTLKNNCNSNTKAYITIDSEYRTGSKKTYLDDSYIKVNLSPKGTTDDTSYILDDLTLTNLENSRKGYIVKTTYLKPDEEKSYDLRIWMDSAVTVDKGLNKTWEGKIIVISESSKDAAPEEWYDAKKGTLLAALRENNTIEEPLTTVGLESSAHTLDDAESITTNVPTMYTSNYVTYGTGYEVHDNIFSLTGVSVTSDTYANSYSSLVGKYIAFNNIYFISSSTSDEKTGETTSLGSIYYVLNATTDSITYKPLSSDKNATEAVMSSAEDDYGTSYYFRGAVKNNYVEFANKCWRIVRVSGDGSIKLVLHNDNTSGVNNPCSSANNNDKGAFAQNTNGEMAIAFNDCEGDNSCVGFMSGGFGKALEYSARTSKDIKASFLSGKPYLISSDYVSAHASKYKSSVLKFLESWYSKELKSYKEYFADTIWCNDKSVVNDREYDPFQIDVGLELGYGDNNNYYKAFKRIVGNIINEKALEVSPSLKCPNDNIGGKLSKFTANDEINGNGDLYYKIGLLTADEVVFSGLSFSRTNSSNYLFENTGDNSYWTMTPAGFTKNKNPYTFYVGESGLNEIITATHHFVRPSISLISQIGISSGNGTSENPYVISASTSFPNT